MSVISTIVLQDDIEKARQIGEMLDESSQVKVLGSSNDGQMGYDLVLKHNPDLVVCDLVLKNMDGLELIPLIKKHNIQTKIVVISSISGEDTINKACSLGADYYMIKPISKEILLKRILTLSDGGSLKNTLDDKLSKIFISVGIPPHIKGYGFLREGVKMVVKNPSIINNITKKLYPMIGERFETTPSKVERAIRHAIEVSWAKGRIDTINSLFGVNVYMGQEKPTNGEFIALIADKMLLDGI